MATYIYEMTDGKPYGYFSGKYLYDTEGTCTHYRGGSDDQYLYKMDGTVEFYQSGKYLYTMDGQPRWYFS